MGDLSQVVHTLKINTVAMKEKRLEILRKLANKELTPEMADEQLLGISFVISRYFGERFTPPFRVGRKQQRIVLDAKGLEVAHFYHADENMADDYVRWLNGYQRLRV